jgi:hypothetical protein
VLACLRRGTVCRPLIIPLPTGLLGVRWLILVLTALLGVGWQLAVLRLVAVCRLLRRRSQKNISKKVYWRACGGFAATLVWRGR